MTDLSNAIADFFESVFAPIVDILGMVLLYFHSLGAPWWLSIVFLTIVVRTVLFPLTIKQVRSMRAMQDLKPEMDRIRAQYRDNRQKQQEEMMKLYQERKVNPLGGCLPILLQMPIFIGIFYVIREFGGFAGTPGTIEDFSRGGILWFTDLSAPDPFFALPILSALTMLAATEITAKNIDPQQRWLMRLLPIGITIFLLTFPAGLFVYWITSNLMTLAQNYLIYYHGPGKKSPAKEVSGTRAGTAGKDDDQAGTGSPRSKMGPKVGEQTTGTGTSNGQSGRAAKRKRRKKKK